MLSAAVLAVHQMRDFSVSKFEHSQFWNLCDKTGVNHPLTYFSAVSFPLNHKPISTHLVILKLECVPTPNGKEKKFIYYRCNNLIRNQFNSLAAGWFVTMLNQLKVHIGVATVNKTYSLPLKNLVFNMQKSWKVLP